MIPLYYTDYGVLYYGDSLDLLNDELDIRKKVNLIFTSPPFPLNKKKAYGNLKGQKYVEWLSGFAEIFSELLTSDGSIVIEIGNAWEKGKPTMSLLPLETLIEFKKKGNFYLCQEFIWNNPARLPSPAQWVNIERIRVKDAFTRLWWLSKTPKPKASNRNILVEYSKSMKKLLKNQSYNAGRRPSEHNIGENSFLKNNEGAIPSNVLTIANTNSTDPYLRFCKGTGYRYHPARMPIQLASFFINFLTNESDLVLDPFSGSNVTGYAAEMLKRRWMSIEKELEYAISSKCRFENAWYSEKVKMGIS